MLKISLPLVFLIGTVTISAQSDDKMQAQKAVETFFDGFHKGDTTLMKSVMIDKFVTQTAFKNKAGEDVLATENSDKLLSAIANRPADQKWDERISAYNVQVDGNMANVWTPYEFWFNDTFSHCGVNSFQLFRDTGQWKIIYLIDTRRRQDCRK